MAYNTNTIEGTEVINVQDPVQGSHSVTIDDIKDFVGEGSSKLVYRALFSQSGTSNPTVVILENTLGAPIVWTRLNTGRYTGTLAGSFLVDKVFGQNFGQNVLRGLGNIGSGNIFMFVEVKRQTDDTILLSIEDNTGDFADLNNYAVIPIEIEIYP